jgi:hypothetical protein
VIVKRSPLVIGTVFAFSLGGGLLFAFGKAVTIAAGVLLLFAFLVLGVFAIASPEYLARSVDRSELPEGGSSRRSE